MTAAPKAAKGQRGPQGHGDAAFRTNSACTEVSEGVKGAALMEERSLLTSLMEAAATGNKDALLGAIRKVAQRYGKRNAAATASSEPTVLQGEEATASPPAGDAADAPVARHTAAAAAETPAATGPREAEGAKCEEFGLDPDLLLGFRDGEGRTVAHFAALGGSSEVVELILRLCPSAAKARDNYGKTPLFTAASLGNTDVLQLLLHSGGDASARSKGGSTAVHEAICAQKAAAIKLLLERGANPNAVSSMGTPLQIATVTQQQEILELLLSRGADPNNGPKSIPDSGHARDSEQDSSASASCCSPFPPALILAASKNDCNCLQLLLQHGADANATDTEGFTALHCVAETDCVECAEQLLKAGANWETAASDGSTPLELARRHKSRAVAQLLEPLGPSPQQPGFPFQRPSTKQRQAAPGAERVGETRLIDDSADGDMEAPLPIISLNHSAPAPREAVAKVEKLKEAGNAAFCMRDYAAAKAKYTQAIEECPKVEAARELLGVLYSNRSFTNEQLEDAQGALADAQAAVQLRPEWSKAQYRLARARRLGGATEEYVAQLWEALRLDPTNSQIREEMNTAVQAARKVHADRATATTPPA